eukprot:gene14355-19252_t
MDEIAKNNLGDSSREEQLLKWTQYNYNNRTSISFSETWIMIKEYGLDIISNTLHTFLSSNTIRSNKKPFGARGHASLTTICDWIVNNDENYEEEGNEGGAKKLYIRVCEFIVDHLSASNKSKMTNTVTLSEIISLWSSLKILVKWLNIILSPLKLWIKNALEYQTFASQSLLTFYREVYMKLDGRLARLVLDEIRREQEGESIDHDLIREANQIFLIMGVGKALVSAPSYNDMQQLKMKLVNIDDALSFPNYFKTYDEDFEVHLLKETRDYYKMKSNQWIQSDVETYIYLVSTALESEEKRAVNYLTLKSKQKLSRIVLEECVLNHQATMFDSLKDIFRGIYNNTQDQINISEGKSVMVKSLYLLFHQVELLEPQDTSYHLATMMCKVFKLYLLELGDIIIADRKSEVQRLQNESKTNKSISEASASDPILINSLLRLFRNIPILVSHIFKNNPAYLQAMNDSFTIIVNKDVNPFSIPQMLAAHCDSLLKGTLKIDGQDLEGIVTNCVEIFHHIYDKDLFCELHRNYLAKRLLNKRSSDETAESQLIGLMKIQQGSQFTSKLEGMLTDLSLSNNIQQNYEPFFNSWKDFVMKENGNNDDNMNNSLLGLKNMSFNVVLLTFGHWPSQKIRNIQNIPLIFKSCIDHFTKYYVDNNQLRKLQWNITLGEVQMKVIMPSSPSSSSRNQSSSSYEVTITTVQAI